MTDPASTPSPGAARRFLPAAAPALLGWALLAALQLLLGRLVPGTGTTDERIPSWARLPLAASELSLLALSIGALAAASALAVKLGRKGRAGRVAGRVLRTVPAAAFLFFWGASWSIFGSTGRFIDQRTLEFFSTNGALVFQFLEAGQVAAAACLGAACVAMPAAWIRWGPGLIARVPERVAASVARVASLFVALCLITAAAGETAARSSKEGVRDLFT